MLPLLLLRMLLVTMGIIAGVVAVHTDMVVQIQMHGKTQETGEERSFIHIFKNSYAATKRSIYQELGGYCDVIFGKPTHRSTTVAPYLPLSLLTGSHPAASDSTTSHALPAHSAASDSAASHSTAPLCCFSLLPLIPLLHSAASDSAASHSTASDPTASHSTASDHSTHSSASDSAASLYTLCCL